jgi:hypothetical protein
MGIINHVYAIIKDVGVGLENGFAVLVTIFTMYTESQVNIMRGMECHGSSSERERETRFAPTMCFVDGNGWADLELGIS